jgi:23S rRNA (cytosine1962-C5)-methyltransferase
MARVPIVRLHKDRDRSLRRRHPWVYSGAVERVEGEPGSGGVIRLVDHQGQFLGWAYFNARSQILARVLDWEESASINDSWWRSRVIESIDRRRDLPALRECNVCRLVHSEADGVPGLIVDRYGEWLVVQALTAGVERVKGVIVEALVEASKPLGVFERSDAEARKLEGLGAAVGRLAGEEPPDRVEVAEGDHRFLVDIRNGQKTGFYIDQRDNRRFIAEYVGGKKVLDLFSYTGGFSVYALRGGASHVTLVESSVPALRLAEANLLSNRADPSRFELVQGNAFETARSLGEAGQYFDVVIVDPPKLAQSRAQVDKAERAYKDVNLSGMKLVGPGGILATFSCSGAIGTEHFSRIVSWASVDAGRGVQILQRLSQGADHPTTPAFPESEYLKGLICRVL